MFLGEGDFSFSTAIAAMRGATWKCMIATIIYYAHVNPKDLWLKDLTELEEQLPDFWASRILKDDEDNDDDNK
jgi:hypothetical protein